MPCQVQATQGTATLQRNVDGAPSSCASSATLSSLAVTGPTAVTEGAKVVYVATATFSNGTPRNVTASAAWSENSAYASIAGGVLTTTTVTANQALPVTAPHVLGAVSRSASLNVTSRTCRPRTLSSLAVTGPASVTEGAPAPDTGTATFSDGSTRSVTASATWTENSAYATIAGGVLTTSAVPSNQAVAVAASFTSGSITRTASVAVTVADVPAATLAFRGGPGGRDRRPDRQLRGDGDVQQRWDAERDGDRRVERELRYASTLRACSRRATSHPIRRSRSRRRSRRRRHAHRHARRHRAGRASSAARHGSHAGRFMTYEGTATCLNCHQAEATTSTSPRTTSGRETPANPRADRGPGGKLGGINDFCIYPDINWLGKLTTVDGKVVTAGARAATPGRG